MAQYPAVTQLTATDKHHPVWYDLSKGHKNYISGKWDVALHFRHSADTLIKSDLQWVHGSNKIKFQGRESFQATENEWMSRCTQTIDIRLCYCASWMFAYKSGVKRQSKIETGLSGESAKWTSATGVKDRSWITVFMMQMIRVLSHTLAKLECVL